MIGNFKRLGVQSQPLDGRERLALLHGQLHPGSREPFRFKWADIAPCLAHAERAALPEVKAIRHDKVFRSHARVGDVRPLEAERLPAAGMKLAMQQGQTLPPVKGLALYPQPLKVADHVRLYTFQTGTSGGHIFSGDAKGDVLGPFDTVVAFGDLFFSIPVYSVRTLLKRSSASEIFTL